VLAEQGRLGMFAGVHGREGYYADPDHVTRAGGRRRARVYVAGRSEEITSNKIEL
jgi:hypothetical protein